MVPNLLLETSSTKGVKIQTKNPVRLSVCTLKNNTSGYGIAKVRLTVGSVQAGVFINIIYMYCLHNGLFFDHYSMNGGR
jgi:hypothetical protein